ncbi:pentapeptide repeat-containing protein, partial [Pseudomonas aeruginosa]
MEKSKQLYNQVNFSHQDLQEHIFSNCTFIHCNFKRSNLRDTQFINCTFIE